MEYDRRGTGKKGEDIACNFLIDNGHTILERNFRSGHLETDIISLDKNGLHFVEVKTRRPPLQAQPEENVGRKKQHHLAAAARAYLASADKSERLGMMECFFDIISIVIDGEKIELKYLPEAFIPMYI